MTMAKFLSVLLVCLVLAACDGKPYYVANIGNAGSLDGPYSLRSISAADVLGGEGGYGAVNGYPGASVDVAKHSYIPRQLIGRNGDIYQFAPNVGVRRKQVSVGRIALSR
jgi:hypothetical protein